MFPFSTTNITLIVLILSVGHDPLQLAREMASRGIGIVSNRDAIEKTDRATHLPETLFSSS
jgi:hypothetical protein